MTESRTALAVTAGAVFVGAVVAANWLTTNYGFVPVGFGLTVTAGTYAAGVALATRDVLQDWGGRGLVAALIVVGAVLSYALADGRIAVASGVAFGVSELLDMTVYTPLRGRASQGSGRWSWAVAASNAAGAVIDTVLFLSIAFGHEALTGRSVLGQLVGKGWVTLVVIGLFVAARRLRHDRTVVPV